MAREKSKSKAKTKAKKAKKKKNFVLSDKELKKASGRVAAKRKLKVKIGAVAKARNIFDGDDVMGPGGWHRMAARLRFASARLAFPVLRPGRQRHGRLIAPAESVDEGFLRAWRRSGTPLAPAQQRPRSLSADRRRCTSAFPDRRISSKGHGMDDRCAEHTGATLR